MARAARAACVTSSVQSVGLFLGVTELPRPDSAGLPAPSSLRGPAPLRALSLEVGARRIDENDVQIQVQQVRNRLNT